MVYTVKCTWDDDAEVWIAESADIPGLVLESPSLDTLMERVKTAASELIELDKLPQNSMLHFISEKTQSIYA